MASHEQNTRNRIIATTIEILDEVTNVDQITVRQIAERANVGIGLVNHHFKTKDNLLIIAIDNIMAKMATSFITPGSYTDLAPVL